MKTTINLGKELGYLASNITDPFITHDYFSELQRQYTEHVENFYVGDFSNDFREIYKFKRFISQSSYVLSPFENPLEDLELVKDSVISIVDNRKGFRSVFNIFASDVKNCSNSIVRTLIGNVITSLDKGDSYFKEVALKMDRHLGNQYSVADLILAIEAYGRLSGIVDFFNFQEGKDD